MTRQRNDEHSTEFGIWLRNQAVIDSKLGYVTTNIDYLWQNYKTGDWMLMEEKRYGAKLTYSQTKLFQLLNEACLMNNRYRGFHTIVFEHTSPDDGRMWLDDKEVTSAELLLFLKDFDLIVAY